jgi:hypothetical protein
MTEGVGFNRYAYAGGDPINASDANGHAFTSTTGDDGVTRNNNFSADPNGPDTREHMSVAEETGHAASGVSGLTRNWNHGSAAAGTTTKKTTERSFKFGSLTFKISGGTPTQQAMYEASLRAVLATKRGMNMAAEIAAKKNIFGMQRITEVTLHLEPGLGNAHGFTDGSMIIDPNFHGSVPTTAGLRELSNEAIIAHELGHVTGALDDGPYEMNNVLANENPVRRELGEPERTEY